MRAYRSWLSAFLLPFLLVAGCRSERVAFQFSSDKAATAQVAVAQPAEAGTTAQEAWKSEVAATTIATASKAPLHRQRALAFAARPRQAAAAPIPFAGRKQAARPIEFWTSRSTERGFLISGAAAGLLGLVANYAAIGSGSRTLLLGTGEFLLWLSAFLLLAWFVLLFIRVRKE